MRCKGSLRGGGAVNHGLCQLGSSIGVEAADGPIVVDQDLVWTARSQMVGSEMENVAAARFDLLRASCPGTTVVPDPALQPEQVKYKSSQRGVKRALTLLTTDEW